MIKKIISTTAPDAILKGLKKNLKVTGCTTSVCVASTVRDAMFRGYSPIVLQAEHGLKTLDCNKSNRVHLVKQKESKP